MNESDWLRSLAQDIEDLQFPIEEVVSILRKRADQLDGLS